MEKDIRTIDKLVNGVNETFNDKHMWLSPLVTPGDKSYSINELKFNTIFLTFDEPISISCITIFNYSKNPSRGAKEIIIELDDRIIYMVLLLFIIECLRGICAKLLQNKNFAKGSNLLQAYCSPKTNN